MPVKQYVREIKHPFTREEMANLLKEAHRACKDKVKATWHPIGQKRKRNVAFRNRAEYLACIQEYIRTKVMERLRAEGVA